MASREWYHTLINKVAFNLREGHDSLCCSGHDWGLVDEAEEKIQFLIRHWRRIPKKGITYMLRRMNEEKLKDALKYFGYNADSHSDLIKLNEMFVKRLGRGMKYFIQRKPESKKSKKKSA